LTTNSPSVVNKSGLPSWNASSGLGYEHEEGAGQVDDGSGYDHGVAPGDEAQSQCDLEPTE
jgi:hypothetical protein